VEPECYAVRWARRMLAWCNEPDWTKWHWTEDGVETLCRWPIRLGAEGSFLPETDEAVERVDCLHCRRAVRNKTY
jgi:hypothetical protein